MALYRASDQFLVAALTVGVRAVEKIDADLTRAVQDADRRIAVGLIALLTNRKFRERERHYPVKIPCTVAKVTPEMSPMVDGTGFELWVPPTRSVRARSPVQPGFFCWASHSMEPGAYVGSGRPDVAWRSACSSSAFWR
jgi:hypothetical protein